MYRFSFINDLGLEWCLNTLFLFNSFYATCMHAYIFLFSLFSLGNDNDITGDITQQQPPRLTRLCILGLKISLVFMFARTEMTFLQFTLSIGNAFRRGITVNFATSFVLVDILCSLRLFTEKTFRSVGDSPFQ